MVEGLAYDGNNLWAYENELNDLYALNPETRDIISQVQVDLPWIHGITFDGDNIWVNDFETDSLYRIDQTDGSILHSIESPDDRGIGITWDGTYLWTDDFGTNLLYQIDPTDGEVLRSLPSPTANSRDLTWDGSYIWTVTWVTDLVYQYDVGEAPTSVEIMDGVPSSFELLGNYPNPFNANTIVSFSISEPADVSLDIYDMLGRKVITLTDRHYETGKHEIKWNGKNSQNRDVSSGMYLYKLSSGGNTETKSMIYLR